jgi:hypothetical protein
MIFGFLERRLALGMQISQALITGIRQNLNMLCDIRLVFFEELKVVFTSLCKGGRYDFGGFSISDHLSFLGMAPFFATVMPFLTFFGRSMGNMKFGSILAPIHQCHQQLIGLAQFGWPTELPAFVNYGQHLIKGFSLNAGQSFEI